MSVRETHGGRRAKLYVRSLLPRGSRRQQSAVLDRLETLAEQGAVDEYGVHVWGKEAPATTEEARTEAGAYALERVSRFREWARRNDVSLDSTFEVTEVDGSLTGERYRSLVFPTFLLAEYREGALACVTPHGTDDRITTVADRLARLDRDEATTFEPLERAGSSGQPTSPAEASTALAESGPTRGASDAQQSTTGESESDGVESDAGPVASE